MDKKDELIKILSSNIRNLISEIKLSYNLLQEIRLRVNAPLIIIYGNQEYFITKEKGLSRENQGVYIVQRNDIREVMEYISSYSLYAFDEEIKQGFITVQGGHRVGIAGKTILEGNNIRSIKNISFMNIRLSHQVKGCAHKVMPFILNERGIYHTLIISPPGCGKTTLLRDIIRQISNGDEENHGLTVGVIDERSEIGACFMGEPQNDLGIRTDILDCCPKAKGMMMMIRSMSPRIIAVDEVGQREDIDAIEYVINCGCKIIATVHGNTVEDIKNKPVLGKLVREKIFERYIILSNKKTMGSIEGIYDERGTKLN